MLRILHLEDDQKDAFLIENAVQENGIDASITVARDRQEFMKAMEGGNFDVVLADSEILGIDGVSALKIVRQKFPGISFICLSGLENPAHIKASFDAGANDYVSKNDLVRLIPILRREADRLK